MKEKSRRLKKDLFIVDTGDTHDGNKYLANVCVRISVLIGFEQAMVWVTRPIRTELSVSQCSSTFPTIFCPLVSQLKNYRRYPNAPTMLLSNVSLGNHELYGKTFTALKINVCLLINIHCCCQKTLSSKMCMIISCRIGKAVIWLPMFTSRMLTTTTRLYL